MKLKTAAALAAPLIAGFIAGCDTPAADAPANFKNPPTVVAVYAVDQVGQAINGNSLPDVLVYSVTEPGKVSKAPPSYGSFRVEFDQPMDGSTLATNNDLSLSSFCSPLKATGSTTTPINLVDLGNASAKIGSSVCYNPTSNLGQNPSVVISLGSGAATDAAPKSPFTCQDFAPDGGDDASGSGNAMKVNNQYAVTLDAARIKGSNGKNLSSDAANTTVKFTTSSFEIMAAGRQDPNTGYFTWLDKPYKGFEKDLDPVAASAFVQSTDSTPFIVVLTEGASNPEVVTATRSADNSQFDSVSAAAYDPAGGGVGDPRVVSVFPGDTWEPGVAYKIVVPTTLAALDGTTLPAAKTYTFTADPTAPLAVLTTGPGDGATDRSLRPSDPFTGTHYIYVEFQAPVDPATLGGITVTPSSGAPLSIPASGISVLSGANNQIVFIDPATPAGANSPFVPATTYTVNVTGVKTQVGLPNGIGGKALAPKKFTFTTVNFSVDQLRGSSGGIDRSTTVNPTDLVTGALIVRFQDTANGVSNTSVHLSEVTPTGTATAIPADPTQVAVTATGGGFPGSRFKVKVTDANYVLKFGQLYRVQADTTITDGDVNANNVALKAPGCTAASCPDVHTFTTAKFIPSISASRSSGVFTITFPFPIDPASVPDLTGPFKLFSQDASKKLTPVAGLSCALSGSNKIKCTPGTPLDANKTYVASAIFTSAAPVLVAATLPGAPNPTDRAVSGKFFGSLTRTFTTPCPTGP